MIKKFYLKLEAPVFSKCWRACVSVQGGHKGYMTSHSYLKINNIVCVIHKTCTFLMEMWWHLPMSYALRGLCCKHCGSLLLVLTMYCNFKFSTQIPLLEHKSSGGSSRPHINKRFKLNFCASEIMSKLTKRTIWTESSSWIIDIRIPNQQQ